MPCRRLIVGIGNPDRGDDGVGRLVARLLADMSLPDVAVIEHGGEAASLINAIEGSEMAVLVDACVSGAPVGTVHRIDAHREDLPDMQFGLSTHDFGLSSAIALGRSLGILPPRCVIYAIEAGQFEPGERLSKEVCAAADIAAVAARSEVTCDA